jgi:ketosteroid isomerase-like protein
MGSSKGKTDMTDQEQSNLQATRALYEVTGRGDWAAAAEMLTDDFIATEAPSVPFVGEYHGRGGLEELYCKVMGMIDATGFDIQQMTAGGDWVVVLLDILARDSEGYELRVPLAEAMRFRNGKCCEIRPYYFDTLLVERAVDAKKLRN